MNATIDTSRTASTITALRRAGEAHSLAGHTASVLMDVTESDCPTSETMDAVHDWVQCHSSEGPCGWGVTSPYALPASDPGWSVIVGGGRLQLDVWLDGYEAVRVRHCGMELVSLRKASAVDGAGIAAQANWPAWNYLPHGVVGLFADALRRAADAAILWGWPAEAVEAAIESEAFRPAGETPPWCDRQDRWLTIPPHDPTARNFGHLLAGDPASRLRRASDTATLAGYWEIVVSEQPDRAADLDMTPIDWRKVAYYCAHQAASALSEQGANECAGPDPHGED